MIIFLVNRILDQTIVVCSRFEQICHYIRFDDSLARRAPRSRSRLKTQDAITPEKKLADSAPKPTSTLPLDRLRPIRPIIDKVRKNICESYKPLMDITVDERMIPFRGRCLFRVFMKAKLCRYGIKVWAAVDARSSVMCNFDIYVGKYSTFTVMLYYDLNILFHFPNLYFSNYFNLREQFHTFFQQTQIWKII